MAATREDISEWFDLGVKMGAEFMIVWCDTFDYEDYPEFVTDKSGHALKTYVLEKDGTNMVQLMEVYSLKSDKEAQLLVKRVQTFEHF